MLNRRDLLRLGAVTWLAAGLPRARAEPRRGPRFIVTIFLRGGIDAVYTLDPKTRREVDADVDVPYGANEIVDGAIPLGPHFAGLSSWTRKMAIVRGIGVHVANHEGGAFQFQRMRTGVMPNMPSLGEIVGQRREQPVASVVLGDLSSFDYSAARVLAPTGSGGKTSLQMLDELDDESLDLLARTYQKHLKAFPSSGLGERQARTREHLEQVAGLLTATSRIPRFKPVDWGGMRDTSADLQRTLWLLENDLTRSVSVKIQFDWDSHFRNGAKQTKANADFVPVFARFLDELEKRKNAHGTLAEQTLVIAGSELGRFPVINGNLGKDHFPETQLMFFGAGIKAGSWGRTASRMQGRKINLATGSVDDPAGVQLDLDDVGATVLAMTGMNPAIYGYRGRRLSFLEAA